MLVYNVDAAQWMMVSMCVCASGLLYMLHKGYCDGAFPMHDEAGDNDPGRKEILEMIWSRYSIYTLYTTAAVELSV